MDRKSLTTSMYLIAHLVHAALPGIVLVTTVHLAGCSNDRESGNGDDVAVALQPAILVTGTDINLRNSLSQNR